jgi:hypothetical protein
MVKWIHSLGQERQTGQGINIGAKFFEQLNWVQLRYPDLFLLNVNIKDDYGIPRYQAGVG